MSEWQNQGQDPRLRPTPRLQALSSSAPPFFSPDLPNNFREADLTDQGSTQRVQRGLLFSQRSLLPPDSVSPAQRSLRAGEGARPPPCLASAWWYVLTAMVGPSTEGWSLGVSQTLSRPSAHFWSLKAHSCSDRCGDSASPERCGDSPRVIRQPEQSDTNTWISLI